MRYRLACSAPGSPSALGRENKARLPVTKQTLRQESRARASTCRFREFTDAFTTVCLESKISRSSLFCHTTLAARADIGIVPLTAAPPGCPTVNCLEMSTAAAGCVNKCATAPWARHARFHRAFCGNASRWRAVRGRVVHFVHGKSSSAHGTCASEF